MKKLIANSSTALSEFSTTMVTFEFPLGIGDQVACPLEAFYYLLAIFTAIYPAADAGRLDSNPVVAENGGAKRHVHFAGYWERVEGRIQDELNSLREGAFQAQDESFYWEVHVGEQSFVERDGFAPTAIQELKARMSDFVTDAAASFNGELENSTGLPSYIHALFSALNLLILPGCSEKDAAQIKVSIFCVFLEQLYLACERKPEKLIGFVHDLPLDTKTKCKCLAIVFRLHMQNADAVARRNSLGSEQNAIARLANTLYTFENTFSDPSFIVALATDEKTSFLGTAAIQDLMIVMCDISVEVAQIYLAPHIARFGRHADALLDNSDMLYAKVVKEMSEFLSQYEQHDHNLVTRAIGPDSPLRPRSSADSVVSDAAEIIGAYREGMKHYLGIGDANEPPSPMLLKNGLINHRWSFSGDSVGSALSRDVSVDGTISDDPESQSAFILGQATNVGMIRAIREMLSGLPSEGTVGEA